MSEDRLERALHEMRTEDVDAGTIETARARVWEKVTNAGGAVCAEFRQEFRAYLGKELGASRRLLVEDHLSRCPSCRTRIAEMKGERTIIAMPRLRQGYGAAGSSSRWVRRGMLAAAAALLLAVVYVGRDTIDAMMGPGGPRATVVSAEGGLYRLTALSAEAGSAKAEGALEAGATIGEREAVRTGPGAHAVLQLADGSTVDINERTRTLRHRCVERPGHPPPTRRPHRQSRQTAPGKPARSDARFDRLGEGNDLRGVRRCGWLGGFGGRGISGGEPARQGTGPQPRRSGRVDPGAGELGGASRLLEPRFAVLLGAACVICEDRTRAREFSHGTADERLPSLASSHRGGRLRRGSKSRPHDQPGPCPRPGAVDTERDVRGLVEFRDGTRAETDCGPHPVGESAARGRNRVLCQRRRNQRARADGDGASAARQAGGARDRS